MHNDILTETFGPIEKYPDDNPKTLVGMTKPSFDCIPPSAEIALGCAMADGGAKYGPMNYREKPISSTVYYNAIRRHLASWLDGEDYSEDTVESGKPVHHLAHVMACCAIIIDAGECGTLKDNRPAKGKASEIIKRLTKVGA